MNGIARTLRDTVESARGNLLAIGERRAAEKPDPRSWSLKEILGHLIDSAANNHQRIVRMQEAEHIGTFTYEQRHWVDAQGYHEEAWPDLVDFWCRYNVHLAHVIAAGDPSKGEQVTPREPR